MPYKIVNRSKQEKPFCVVKVNPDKSTETVACHKTKKKAKAQITALNIAESTTKIVKVISAWRNW